VTEPRPLPPGGFTTVFGHELVGELPAFVHRPYLVVTMADLWPRFQDRLAGPHLAGVHLVETLELDELVALEEGLPRAAAIIGLGGGQALDVAKFLAWTRRLPLFQVPTATTVNAPFGHRSGLRDHGRVRYLGWAVPEARLVQATRLVEDARLVQGAWLVQGDWLAQGGWRGRRARGRTSA